MRFVIALAIFTCACTTANVGPASAGPTRATNEAAAHLRELVPADDASIWQRIRKERVQKLLPDAMTAAGVDAWVVFVRENANDPLAIHVGGENAGGTAAIIFLRTASGVRSLALSPSGEATALRDIGLHDEVRPFERGDDVF